MSGLLGRWVRWATAGEFVGFLIPALVAALVLVDPQPYSYPAAVAGGALEGAVLGWAQLHVLRGVVPAVSGRRWVVGTAVAAAVAWAIGLLPSTAYDVWSRWPGAVAVGVGAVGAVVLLSTIGVAQWLELRRHVVRSGSWVGANMLAWALGLTAMLVVTTPLWQEGQSTPVVIAIGALGGLVMAATMALTTGLALRRLLAHRGAHGDHGRRAGGGPQTAPVKPVWRHAS